ncbi:flavin monoamine oxidase family protein [Rubinisphaera margarita]|uniref:flavin monoamine oxidase family protein n=1 Tax=Rubinisphaera margarita TaxID=2909586 RepID=UPI001EE88298|nr:FAD-dependent oxidoreductase [Rubinisphaera margarita]MCG6158291.1 FAD-dependent oxidoreductase [Rubinisphaera margarita]
MSDGWPGDWRTNRRELLHSALLAATTPWLSGCGESTPPLEGELLSPSFDLGHRIRDGFRPPPPNGAPEEVEVLIVGGGIAGLSAGWRLKRAGIENFRILEMEPVPGGTSRSGKSPLTAYPWGAHYVPFPNEQNRALLQLLEEMGAVSRQSDGTWQPAESVACRTPQERLFAGGRWVEGLFPGQLATEEDARQWERFEAEINHWIDWRDAEGRPAFTIPVDRCSPAEEVAQLDALTMTDWLNGIGVTSNLIHWYVDYCCRDDYGLNVDQTSAWAGIFYFASRKASAAEEEAPLLTWPAGNGAIVDFLSNLLASQLRTGQAVIGIRPGNQRTKVSAFDLQSETVKEFSAERVIFAAPQFMAPYLIPSLNEERRSAIREFQYGSWVVANLHLSQRPSEDNYPLSWDNVLFESLSLGYVVATHQLGSDFGPTVWTWYYPLCDEIPAEARKRLLNSTWEEWTAIVFKDLDAAHPQLTKYVTKIDVMRWGHAMVQPRPGFLTREARKQARQPLGPIHFAGTDLSGLALMEEAFYHGLRAAEEVLAAANVEFNTYL